MIIETLASRHDGAAEVFLAYGLATETLRLLLGNDHTNELVFSMHPIVRPSNRASRGFLKTDEPDDPAQVRHQQRVFTLAELLFNLQHLDGIDHRVTKIREGNLEATVAELECAGQLVPAGINFSFVKEIGTRGEDYEGEILLSSGTVVNVEVKSKTDSTQLSEGTLRSTLNAARSQLPSGQPGIIFVKLAEPWVGAHEMDRIGGEVLRRFFRQTSRVVAVIFRWTEYHRNSDQGTLVLNKFRVERNIQSGLLTPEIEDLLQQIEQPADRQWVSFWGLLGAAGIILSPGGIRHFF